MWQHIFILPESEEGHPERRRGSTPCRIGLTLRKDQVDCLHRWSGLVMLQPMLASYTHTLDGRNWRSLSRIDLRDSRHILNFQQCQLSEISHPTVQLPRPSVCQGMARFRELFRISDKQGRKLHTMFSSISLWEYHGDTESNSDFNVTLLLWNVKSDQVSCVNDLATTVSEMPRFNSKNRNCTHQ